VTSLLTSKLCPIGDHVPNLHKNLYSTVAREKVLTLFYSVCAAQENPKNKRGRIMCDATTITVDFVFLEGFTYIQYTVRYRR
jgi:hypothetical protein